MRKKMFQIRQSALSVNPKWRPGKTTMQQSFLMYPRANVLFLFILITLCCSTPNESFGLSISYDYIFSGTMGSESNVIDGPHLCSPGDPFSGVMRYTYDSDAQPIGGHYNGPDDFWEIYPHAFEYAIIFNGIGLYSATDLIVSSDSIYTPPNTIALTAYGMGTVNSNDPKLWCSEAELDMLYRDPVISGSNRLPPKLHAEQIDDMLFWCYMEYHTSPEHMENMFIDVWAQVDTVTPIAPVPEPSAVLILGTGMLSLAGFRKKLKK